MGSLHGLVGLPGYERADSALIERHSTTASVGLRT